MSTQDSERLPLLKAVLLEGEWTKITDEIGKTEKHCRKQIEKLMKEEQKEVDKNEKQRKEKAKKDMKRLEKIDKITQEQHERKEANADAEGSAVHWFFTAWERPTWDPDKVVYLRFQREIGELERQRMIDDFEHIAKEHYQGCLTMKSKSKGTAVRNALGFDTWRPLGYLKPVRSHTGSLEYTGPDKIDGTAVPNSLEEFGNAKAFAPGQGNRTDLDDLAKRVVEGGEITYAETLRWSRNIQALKDRVTKEKTPKWRDVEVYVITGPTGWGKDTMAAQKCEELGIDYFDMPDQTGRQQIYWGAYAGEKALRFKDFYGQVSLHQFLNLFDGTKYPVDIKYGGTYAQWTHIFLTSNIELEFWWNRNEVDKYGGFDALYRRIKYIIKLDQNLSGKEVRRPIVCKASECGALAEAMEKTRKLLAGKRQKLCRDAGPKAPLDGRAYEQPKDDKEECPSKEHAYMARRTAEPTAPLQYAGAKKGMINWWDEPAKNGWSAREEVNDEAFNRMMTQALHGGSAAFGYDEPEGSKDDGGEHAWHARV